MTKISTLIAKSTSSCNLACSYCYAECPRVGAKFIDEIKFVDFFDELLNSSLIDTKFQFIWHGGEPTLFPAESAENIMRHISDETAKKGISCEFSIQSNGFNFPEKWLFLIEKFDIHVGISIDGPAEIHDLSRKTAAGKGSYSAIKSNIDYLRSKYIPVSLLSVIDKRHLGKEELFMEWIKNMDASIKLNPLFSLNSPIEGNFGDYFLFLENLFEPLLKSNFDKKIAPFESLLETLIWDKRPRVCSNSDSCIKFLCFDFENNISPCGRFFENRNFSICYEKGKVKESVEAIQAKVVEFRNQHREKSDCRNCRCVNFCNGGCSAIMYDSSNSDYCSSFRNFYDFLSTRGLVLLKKHLLEEKSKSKIKIEEAESMLEAMSENE